MNKNPSNHTPAEKKTKIFTCHGGEVDADQQREEAGDVGQHVAVWVSQRVVRVLHRLHVSSGNQIPFLIVGPKQVLCRVTGRKGRTGWMLHIRKDTNMLSFQIANQFAYF